VRYGRPPLAEERRVIVVGSGPPGAAAALFLSRAGADVLMLEAGSPRGARGLSVYVRGFTVLKYRRPLKQNATFTASADPEAELYEEIAPGGLTNHWSCAVPRFSNEDFADAKRAGEATEWPITYDDLAPWYDQIEPLLRIAGGAVDHAQLPLGKVRKVRPVPAGWSAMADESRRLGRTLAPMPYVYGAETGVTLSGTIFNAFVRLVAPELRAGRIETRFDARVVSLEWSPDRRRVVAVIVRDARTGGETRVPCAAVVLAAGAIRTAEVLLSSKSADFPDGLGNTHGVLGHYLHDHPLGKIIVEVDRPLPVHPPMYLTRPTLDRTPPLYAAAAVQWGGTEILARSARSRHLGRLRWTGFNLFGTMPPSADNWVGLDRGRSAASGGVDLHIHHPPEARLALEHARDDLMETLRRTGRHPSIRAWLIEPPGNSIHYGGTCRMHASPRYGMLDGTGRMHAVRNVVVADSSAFTTGPEKNPVLTAMSLSARASSKLANDIKAGDL
jgi:choline dehydrogenase-like flavoprotein